MFSMIKNEFDIFSFDRRFKAEIVKGKIDQK